VKREDLEHLIRAAASVLGEPDVLVIGSQAILGSYNDSGLPADVTLSIEADLGSFEDPDEHKADQIHGALGELSPFHQSFGVYGDGITAASAVLPAGWQDRLVPLADSTGSGAVGWCLDIHDLCAAKVYAGRPKDLRFVGAAVEHRLVDPVELATRVASLPGDPERVETAAAYLQQWRSPLTDRDRPRWWRARREAIRQRHLKAPRSNPGSTGSQGGAVPG
jgi:hypothetical protein